MLEVTLCRIVHGFREINNSTQNLKAVGPVNCAWEMKKGTAAIMRQSRDLKKIITQNQVDTLRGVRVASSSETRKI